MKINWGKVLDFALDAGVTVAKTELWVNEKIRELSDSLTQSQALVEIAYEVAKMDNDAWQYLKLHLDVKAGKNELADFMLNYCNYVVNLENSKIKGLLSTNINEAFEALQFDFRNGMAVFEVAAHYGILAAYGETSPRANSLTQAFGRLLNSGQ